MLFGAAGGYCSLPRRVFLAAAGIPRRLDDVDVKVNLDECGNCTFLSLGKTCCAMVMRFDVVICGGSLAGMALGAALARGLGAHGNVAIVDRKDVLGGATAGDLEPDYFANPRAFSISAGSKHMLEALGVWGEAGSFAQPVLAIEISDTSLDSAVRPPLVCYENVVEGGEAASYIVPEPAIRRALREAIGKSDNVMVIAPAIVEHFEAVDGGVCILLVDGRELKASLLVAADGARSTMRAMAGVKTVSWDYNQTGLVTVIAHEKPHEGVALQHFLPGGPFACLPLKGDQSCITWSEDAREAERISALGDDAFVEEVDRRLAGRFGAIKLAGGRQSWPLKLNMSRGLVAERFALVGDAVRAVHPIAGQGFNLGLRDVAALAEVIADRSRVGLDIGGRDGLQRYERWRRFDGAMSAAAFDGLNRLFSVDWAPVRSMREVGLGIVDRVSPLKEAFVREGAGLMGDLPRLMRGEAL